MTPAPRAARALYLLLLAWTALYAGAPLFTNDAFWHVATGRLLLEQGGFPALDPFSYTATDQRWHLHEWLSQVLLAVVDGMAGLHGLRLVGALGALLILRLCCRLWRRELGSHWWGLGGAVLFLVLGAQRLQVRPTLFTIAALLLLVGVLLRARPFRWRHVLLLAGLELAWVNAHSVGLIGVFVFAAHLLGEALKLPLQTRGPVTFARTEPRELGRRGTALGLMLLATLLTPDGLALWAFALQDKAETMQFIPDEWGTFSFVFARNEALPLPTWLGVLGCTALVAVTYAALAWALHRSSRRLALLPDPGRVLLLLTFFAGGFLARRFHWFHMLTALLCLAILRDLGRAGCFAALADVLRRPAPRRIAAAVTAAVMLLLCSLGLDVEQRFLPAAVVRADYYRRPVQRSFQLDGIAFLADAGLQGNVFCHYGSGGMLSYWLYPDVRVSIDSRIDLYRRELYLEWLAIKAGRPDQQALLDRRGTSIYYQHWELPPPVDQDAWLLVFAAPGEAVWLRRGATTAVNLPSVRSYWEARGLPFDPQRGLAAPGR